MDAEHILLQGCRENYVKSDIIELCMRSESENFESLDAVRRMVPAIASDGLHYRNVYCTQCNGFTGETCSSGKSDNLDMVLRNLHSMMAS